MWHAVSQTKLGTEQGARLSASGPLRIDVDHPKVVVQSQTVLWGGDCGPSQHACRRWVATHRGSHASVRQRERTQL
jgi:hypothetical protein